VKSDGTFPKLVWLHQQATSKLSNLLSASTITRRFNAGVENLQLSASLIVSHLHVSPATNGSKCGIARWICHCAKCLTVTSCRFISVLCRIRQLCCCQASGAMASNMQVALLPLWWSLRRGVLVVLVVGARPNVQHVWLLFQVGISPLVLL
jgi:hypothetical protein